MPKQKRSLKHTKRCLSRKKQQKRKNGGGCSCMFSGGSVVGVTPGLAQLSNLSYYPLNTYANDPNYLSVAQRQTANFLMNGGRKGRAKSNRKRSAKTKGKHTSRKIHGGSSSGTLIGNTIDTLKDVTYATVTGANAFSSALPITPYSRYETEYPPRA